MDQPSETTCPFCFEQVHREASRCRHCGSDIEANSRARQPRTKCECSCGHYETYLTKQSALHWFPGPPPEVWTAPLSAGPFPSFQEQAQTIPSKPVSFIGPLPEFGPQGLQPDGTIIYREKCRYIPWLSCTSAGCRVVYLKSCYVYPE
jgi:hypothetical protein